MREIISEARGSFELMLHIAMASSVGDVLTDLVNVAGPLEFPHQPLRPRQSIAGAAAAYAERISKDALRPFTRWLLAIARNRLTDSAWRYARRAAYEVHVDDVDVTFSTERWMRSGRLASIFPAPPIHSGRNECRSRAPGECW